MAIEHQDGKITFYFLDLVRMMDKETKRELAENLLWDQEMFDELIESLMSNRIVTPNFDSYIYAARMKMKEMLPEMSRNIIRSLIHEMNGLKQEVERLDKWAWSLYHAWPKDASASPPPIPEFVANHWPSEERIDEVINEHND